MLRDHGGDVEVVGVAEPRDYWRSRLAERHGIPQSHVFTDWREPLSLKRFADAVVIATPDRLHAEPAIACARQGYHILLEKPMAPTEEECKQIVSAARSAGVLFAVCHVLRYTPYTRMLKDLIESGAIGDPVSIQHLEPVGYTHQAHSFVRGNWGNSQRSCFMLLAKSCHDLDWITAVMGKPVTRVASFGSRHHFRAEHAPSGAAARCLDCPFARAGGSDGTGRDACPYSAVRIYLDAVARGETAWPIDVITDEVTPAGVERALREGPYGLCVYGCDNDVVDHQVVSLEFAGGATGVFTMTAFTEMGQGRKTRIFGTHGQLTGDGDCIELVNFRSGETIRYEGRSSTESMEGHGGADAAMIAAFVQALVSNDAGNLMTGPEETLASHRIVFAAERARIEGRVVEL